MELSSYGSIGNTAMEQSFVVHLAICLTIIHAASTQLEPGAFDHERGINVTNILFDDPFFDADRSVGNVILSWHFRFMVIINSVKNTF